MRCTADKDTDRRAWVTEVRREGGETRLADALEDACRQEATRFFAMRPDIDWFQSNLPVHVKFPAWCHRCVRKEPPSDLWNEVTFDEWNLLQVLHG